MEIKVINGEEKQRLDKYISNVKQDISRTMIKKLIEEENILVNGKKVKTSYIVQNGDTITINIPEAKCANIVAQDIPLDIIYEDNDIIVVNKAKGMVVHPAVRKFRWNFSKCNYGTLQRKLIWNWWRNKTRNSSQTR